MEGMNTCKDVSVRLSEQLSGLGEQIAFKRADLPLLLEKQQECKEAIQSSKQQDKIEAKRREAEEHLRKRSFVKTQIALSECLKMLADVDFGEVEMASLQASISDTKKVHI